MILVIAVTGSHYKWEMYHAYILQYRNTVKAIYHYLKQLNKLNASGQSWSECYTTRFKFASYQKLDNM